MILVFVFVLFRFVLYIYIHLSIYSFIRFHDIRKGKERKREIDTVVYIMHIYVCMYV